jgi:iron complex outermembrane receptor protein
MVLMGDPPAEPAVDMGALIMTLNSGFAVRSRRRDQLTTSMLSRSGMTLAVAALAAGAATSAAAQSAPPPTASTLEQVVVTARKKSESLMTVPIAISALTAKDLQASHIESLIDISEYVPGVTIDNDGSDHVDRSEQSIFIRGMSSGVSPSVSVFIDGAPVAVGFISDVSDAERVEVLKGPQSAFFGRETFGGAINIVTRDPSDVFGGSFDGLYGSDNWYDLKGSLEGPLLGDKLTARVSVRDYSTDGQYKSSIAPYSDLGAQSTKSVSVTLKYEPFNGLTMKAYFGFWDDHDGPAPVYKIGASSYNCNAGAGPAGVNNYYCGTLPTVNTSTVAVPTALDSLFRSQVFGNSSGTLIPLFPDLLTDDGLVRHGFNGHLTIDYLIPGTGLKFTSLTAGNVQESQDNVNLDNENTSNIFNFYTLYGIPNIESYYTWNARVQRADDDVSQEFRITSDQTKRFRYTVGASFARSSDSVYIDGLFPFGAADFGGGGPQIDTVYGVFGSASYDVTSKLKVTFEGRYQVDHIAVYNRAPPMPLTLDASTTSGDFLPRAIIQYDITPSTMVYVTYSKGVNPPVFNTDLVGLPAQVDAEYASIYGVKVAVKPEYLENYETGVKGRFFENTLQVAADIYFDNWTNQILSQFLSVPGVPGYLGGAPDTQTVQTNGGDTHLYGAELDGQWLATPRLLFGFSAAYNKTEIETYPGYFCPGDSCTPNAGTTNIVGHSLPNVPLFSANLSATYTGDIGPNMKWYVRGDYIYRDSQYTDLSNLAKIGDSNRFNFRVGVTKEKTSLEVFILNAFNNRQYQSVNGTTDIDGQPNAYGAYPFAAVLGLPVLRQVGVRLKSAF